MTTKIIPGHVLDRLRELPDESVHCVVTSPPYWGLRNYQTSPQIWGADPECEHDWGAILLRAGSAQRQGTTSKRVGRSNVEAQSGKANPQGSFCSRCGAWLGHLGLEPDYRLYVEHIVSIFDELWRVLRADGTAWLVIGDCYATGAGAVGKRPCGGAQGDRWAGMLNGNGRANRGAHLPNQAGKAAPRIEAMGPITQPNRMPQPGLKPKDLVGIPWRVAFALQDRGWWLRKDNIWHKPNSMPESTEDRCTTSHEYVFHLAKAERYFYDGEAIKELGSDNSHGGLPTEGGPKPAMLGQNIGGRMGIPAKKRRPSAIKGSFGGKWANTDQPAFRAVTELRNKRSVWTIATVPLAEPHFAAFPPELAEVCIKAGTSERGVCPKCGAPWKRITRRIDKGWDGSTYGERAVDATGGAKDGGTARLTLGSSNGKLTGETETISWRPTCGCDAGDPLAATVLDPFLGAGTTALVADRIGRNCIGIELNPAYADMARSRIERDAGMFADIAAE